MGRLVDGAGQVIRVRYGVQWQGVTGGQSGGSGSAAPASHANRPVPPDTTATLSTYNFEQAFEWDALGNRRWMVQRQINDPGEPATSLTLRNSVEGLNRYADATVDFTSGLYGASFEWATAHDRWGRVTRDGERLYDWDAEGNLRAVRLADDGTTVATYCYDSAGRRVSRTVWFAMDGSSTPEHTIRFVWDGDRVIEEWLVNPAAPATDRGTLVAEYIWGAPAPNGLLAQRRDADYPRVWNPHEALHTPWPAEVENDEWTHPLVDSRGNLRALVSESGSVGGDAVVLERRAVTATGMPVAVNPDNGSLTDLDNPGAPVPSRYGPALLTGHHWDPYAKWHYAWHRWISPFTYGRFTSHSPLAYPVAELNYEWVNRNPWAWVDLDGLHEWAEMLLYGGPPKPGEFGQLITATGQAIAAGANYLYGLAEYSYDYGQGAFAAVTDLGHPQSIMGMGMGLSPNVFLPGGAGDGYEAVAGVARDPGAFIVGAGLSAVPVGRAAALAGGAAAKILPSLSNTANKLSNWARNLFRQKCPPTAPAPNSATTALTKFYPENAGFAGATERTFLYPGQMIDRYGGSGYSRFFSPQGTAGWARSLPPGTAGQPLRTFEVVKPFEVRSGSVAPWFNQPGGGTQFVSPVKLETLLNRGIIREVAP